MIFVYAQDQAGGIGYKGDLPWHLPDEMAHFKATTLHQTVVMGRTTFASMGDRPLKQRRNIVLSNHLDKADVQGVEVVPNLETLLAMEGVENFYVIGGQSLYESLYPYAHELIRTVIHQTFVTDRSLAAPDPKVWRLVASKDEVDRKTGIAFTIEKWQRYSDESAQKRINGTKKH